MRPLDVPPDLVEHLHESTRNVGPHLIVRLRRAIPLNRAHTALVATIRSALQLLEMTLVV
jgi:hypothetical protein